MRTYQSKASDTKKKGSKQKIWYGVLFGVTAIAVAVVITLSIALNKKPTIDLPIETPGTDEPDVPVVVTPDNKLTFSLPMDVFTISAHAELEQIVWNSSLDRFETHNGVDFSGAAGDNVMAVANGTVTKVEHLALRGTVITITHAEGYVSTYMGLDTNASVEAGDTVTKGQKIGTVAPSMAYENNEGPHLHLEIAKNGARINPLTVLPDAEK